MVYKLDWPGEGEGKKSGENNKINEMSDVRGRQLFKGHCTGWCHVEMVPKSCMLYG